MHKYYEVTFGDIESNFTFYSESSDYSEVLNIIEDMQRLYEEGSNFRDQLPVWCQKEIVDNINILNTTNKLKSSKINKKTFILLPSYSDFDEIRMEPLLAESLHRRIDESNFFISNLPKWKIKIRVNTEFKRAIIFENVSLEPQPRRNSILLPIHILHDCLKDSDFLSRINFDLKKCKMIKISDKDFSNIPFCELYNVIKILLPIPTPIELLENLYYPDFKNADIIRISDEDFSETSFYKRYNTTNFSISARESMIKQREPIPLKELDELIEEMTNKNE